MRSYPEWGGAVNCVALTPPSPSPVEALTLVPYSCIIGKCTVVGEVDQDPVKCVGIEVVSEIPDLTTPRAGLPTPGSHVGVGPDLSATSVYRVPNQFRRGEGSVRTPFLPNLRGK